MFFWRYQCPSLPLRSKQTRQEPLRARGWRRIAVTSLLPGQTARLLHLPFSFSCGDFSSFCVWHLSPPRILHPCPPPTWAGVFLWIWAELVICFLCSCLSAYTCFSLFLIFATQTQVKWDWISFQGLRMCACKVRRLNLDLLKQVSHLWCTMVLWLAHTSLAGTWPVTLSVKAFCSFFSTWWQRFTDSFHSSHH